MTEGKTGWRAIAQPAAGYLVAIAITACFVAVGLAFRSTAVGNGLPVLLLAAVLVSAQVGGFGPALLATLVSVVATDYFLVKPFGSLGVESPADVLELLVICALGAILGRQLSALRPIRSMSRLMDQVATERDFSQRLGVAGNHPVGQLAQNIDVLLATVDDTLRTHRDFMAETAHDLRNPLLALRTNLDLLSDEDDARAKAQCLDEARLQIERMTRLIADIMILSDRETFLLANHETLNFARVVRKAVAEARRYSGDHRISLDAPGSITVVGSELRLLQIVSNLVDNALKHTPPSAAVKISLQQQGSEVLLTVSDTGPGIPTEHLPYLFRRGYRGSPQTAGHGLGLAIVERLTEAHGGHVEATNLPEGGSSFVVSLPAAPVPVSSPSSGRSQTRGLRESIAAVPQPRSSGADGRWLRPRSLRLGRTRSPKPAGTIARDSAPRRDDA